MAPFARPDCHANALQKEAILCAAVMCACVYGLGAMCYVLSLVVVPCVAVSSVTTTVCEACQLQQACVEVLLVFFSPTAG